MSARSAARLKAVTAVAIGALVVAGCGSSRSEEDSDKTTTASSGDTVDDAQVETGIEDSLSTASVKVTNAKCPADVVAQPGATFTCDVSFNNGATGKATVTQAGLTRYTYELKAGSVKMPGETVEAALEKELAAQGAPNTTVNCPENIKVKVGTTVTCDVSGAQGAASGTVTFTFSSAEGSVEPASVTTA